MSEVFNIAIDLSELKQALKISEEIKNNLSIPKNHDADFINNIKNSNKSLKEQSNLLKGNLKTISLIKMISKGMIGAGAILGGLATAGIMAGVNAMKGATNLNRTAENIGISLGDAYALDFASQMGGLEKNALLSTTENVSNTLTDITKYGRLAQLGFGSAGIDELKNKNPIQATFDIVDALGKSDLPTYLKEEIANDIGIPFRNFKSILRDGTDELRNYFEEGTKIYGDNYKNLKKGDQALIRFGTEIKQLSMRLGVQIAPSMIKALKTLMPYIEQASDKFANFIGDFTKKDANGVSDFDRVLSLATTTLKGFNEVIQAIIDFWNGGKAVWTDINNSFSDYTTELSDAYKEGGLGGFFKTFLGIDGKDRTLTVGGGNAQKQDIIQDGKKVNDVVITKHGEVIQTSPEDYLFATKTPNALSNSASVNNNYTININAVVRNDNDIQSIKNKLNNLIKSINCGRA